MTNEVESRVGLRMNAGAMSRPGLPLVRGLSLSSGDEALYAAVPPSLWCEAERLYVTGVATSFSHLRALLRHGVLRDLPERVLEYHFSRRREHLERERDAHLTRQQEALAKEQLEVSASPTASRYQRVGLNLLALLDGVVLERVLGREDFDFEDLKNMASLYKTLSDADLILSKRRGTERVEGQRAIVREKADAILEKMREFRAGDPAASTQGDDEFSPSNSPGQDELGASSCGDELGAMYEENTRRLVEEIQGREE